MKRRTAFSLVTIILLSGCFIGATTATEGSTDGGVIDDAQERTAAVASLGALGQQQPLHVATGLALGAGIGLVVGSVTMFGYWSRKL